MIEKSISMLGVIGGIIIGWSLNQLSYWYKGRKEDNRVRKQVLFYLFEIRNVIPRLNINAHFKLAQTYLSDKFPDLKGDIINSEQFDVFIDQLLAGALSKMQAEFIETDYNFKQSISSLASVDPLLAYQLSGNTFFIKLGGIYNLIKDSLPGDEHSIDIKVLKSYFNESDEKHFLELQDYFENYIKTLSWRIGIITFVFSIKTIRQLKVREMQKNTDAYAELDTYLKACGINPPVAVAT